MNFEIKYTKGDLIIAKNLDNLNEYLSRKKSNIDQYKLKWDRTKKLINNYEYIYYNYNKNNNISDITPISRSFFKLKEILVEFKIIENIENSKVFCMAEAPGGFIQSLQEYTINKIYGTTLLSNTDKKELIDWHKGQNGGVRKRRKRSNKRKTTKKKRTSRKKK